MEPAARDLKAILAGGRPDAEDLSGVTFDGRRMPRRERKEPWNLGGIILRGAVVTHLDLRGANFKEADLSGAAFRNVDLTRADFSGASAAGAVFEDVNLMSARFTEADLRGAALTFANLSDIDLKDADLRGAAVNGVRLSLNGGTHCLGLKEALSERYGPVSYPFVSGVSGDAFWLSYSTETGTLSWGGGVGEMLGQGLSACGFEWKLTNELDREDAWSLMGRELAAGNGVITPLHVANRAVTGSGFAGSIWVYVKAYDRETDQLVVRCLLGDELRFSRPHFLREWCRPHDLTVEREERVYTFAVIGRKKQEVGRHDAFWKGVWFGLDLLDRGEVKGAVCGIPAYDFLLRDLEIEPEAGEEGCSWIGLGLRHHHGSRWAIRDFLREGRELHADAPRALDEAIRHYEGVLVDLEETLKLLPDSLQDEGEEGEGAREQFLANRDAARARIRSARAGEEGAQAALRRLIDQL